MGALATNFLKIGELADACGLPISTIRHYINEGLLGKPQKTSKNMAYYDKDSIPKVSFIKQLQDELFLPLKVIKKLFFSREELTYDDYELIMEVKRRLAELSELLPEISAIPHSKVMRHIALTEEEMTEIEERGALSPATKDGEKYYDEVDYRLIKALSNFRALGFTADLGITADDFDIYLRLIREMVRSETQLFIERIAKGKTADVIVELVRKGIPAINEVISSLHHKVIMDELRNLEKMANTKQNEFILQAYQESKKE